MTADSSEVSTEQSESGATGDAGEQPRQRGILSRLVPGAIRRRYAAKFVVSLLLVLVVIATVGGLGVFQTESIVQASTEKQLQETSELRAASIGEFVGSMKLQVRTASAGKPLQNGTAQSRYLRLERDRATSDVLAFHLVDRREGTITASTVTPLEGVPVTAIETPWATATLPSGPGNETAVWQSNRSYRSPVFDNEPVIAFASPVPQQSGQYVVAVARIQDHLDTIESTRTNQQTTIINTDGQPVLRPDSTFDSSAHRQQVRAVRTSRTTAFEGDDEFVYAYALVPGTEWVAITTIDRSTAFRVKRQVTANVWFIIAAALVALGGVGFLLWRQTVTPLSELRDRAKRMEAGDLSVALETDRVDEIGRLYQSFASMRDELAEQIYESEQARKEAERHAQVAEAARAEAEELAEQLKAEKQRSDEQFHTLFETAPDPVVMVAADGTIEEVNPAFAAVFDADTEAIVDTEFTNLGFQPESRVCKLTETLQTGDPDAIAGETYTLEYDRDGSETATVELNADRLFDGEAYSGWVGILRDITERERQRRKLEEKNDRLEQFASIVSHDLRNPLNVANGYVKIAKDRLGAEQAEPLLEIESAHDRMYQLIDELLTLAQQGESLTDTMTVEPHRIAEGSWDGVDTAEATLQSVATIDPIEADPSRLSQLFENLFRNAVEHNPETVTVTVGPLSEEPGFFVEDDGEGIPESERDAIFDHGYTTADDGTGFGLSIVDRIAGAHGWSVDSVESAAGGARFEIRYAESSTTVSPDKQ